MHNATRLPATLNRADLEAAMRACPQAPGLSVLEHGYAVADAFAELLHHLRGGSLPAPWWRVPAWANDPLLLEALAPQSVITEYQVFHDCGKPFCRTVDAMGRQHFPGHAALSEQAWLATGGNPLSARLMGLDMDAHLLTPDGVAGFAARPEAATLLLTALAEVHANADMFGGTASPSFKAKAKHLARRGRQVLAVMKGGHRTSPRPIPAAVAAFPAPFQRTMETYR